MGEAEKIIRETYENSEKGLRYLDAIYKKVAGNNKEININIDKNVKSLAGLNVPSYIPDITGKQIYKLSKLGWRKDQICAISGYSPEEAQKKYDTYVRNNV